MKDFVDKAIAEEEEERVAAEAAEAAGANAVDAEVVGETGMYGGVLRSGEDPRLVLRVRG